MHFCCTSFFYFNVQCVAYKLTTLVNFENAMQQIELPCDCCNRDNVKNNLVCTNLVGQ